MRARFSLEAKETLRILEDFVDTKNTQGAGKRFVKKFKAELKKYIQPHTTYKLCNNSYLADEGFSCISINNWIVVFKIEKNTFFVYDIIWGAWVV